MIMEVDMSDKELIKLLLDDAQSVEDNTIEDTSAEELDVYINQLEG